MRTMILIPLLFCFSICSLIFQKGKLEDYKKKIIEKDLTTMMTLFSFEDITFQNFIFNYKNINLYQISNIEKKNFFYNKEGIEIEINNKSNLIELNQKDLNNPFLNFEIEFQLTNLDTLKSYSGKFKMISENIRIQKIYDQNSDIKGRTLFTLTYLNLEITDLPIEQEFLNNLIKFFCYSQEKKISDLFNKKAVEKCFEIEIKSQKIIKVKINNEEQKENTIKFSQNSVPKILSSNIIQIPLSGSVNERFVESEIDPNFTPIEENLFYMNKEIFYNLLVDNIYDFEVTNNNILTSDFKLSMKYLKIIIPDFQYLYPDSIDLKLHNKMIKFSPVFGKLKFNGMLYIHTEIKSINDDLSILKFNQSLNITLIPQYSKELNLQIFSITLNDINILNQEIRIQNKQLLVKWIENCYKNFLLKGKNSFVFVNGIDLMKEDIIDFEPIIQDDENWLKFLEKKNILF